MAKIPPTTKSSSPFGIVVVTDLKLDSDQGYLQLQMPLAHRYKRLDDAYFFYNVDGTEVGHVVASHLVIICPIKETFEEKKRSST